MSSIQSHIEGLTTLLDRDVVPAILNLLDLSCLFLVLWLQSVDFFSLCFIQSNLVDHKRRAIDLDALPRPQCDWKLL